MKSNTKEKLQDEERQNITIKVDALLGYMYNIIFCYSRIYLNPFKTDWQTMFEDRDRELNNRKNLKLIYWY